MLADTKIRTGPQTNQQASNETEVEQASKHSPPCIATDARTCCSSREARKLTNTPPRSDFIPPQDVNRILEVNVMACNETLNNCRMPYSASSDRLPVTGKWSEGRDGSAIPMRKGSSCRSSTYHFSNTHGTRLTWMCGRGMGGGGCCFSYCCWDGSACP